MAPAAAPKVISVAPVSTGCTSHRSDRQDLIITLDNCLILSKIPYRVYRGSFSTLINSNVASLQPTNPRQFPVSQKNWADTSTCQGKVPRPGMPPPSGPHSVRHRSVMAPQVIKFSFQLPFVRYLGVRTDGKTCRNHEKRVKPETEWSDMEAHSMP